MTRLAFSCFLLFRLIEGDSVWTDSSIGRILSRASEQLALKDGIRQNRHVALSVPELGWFLPMAERDG
jgi:hypothetical protein